VIRIISKSEEYPGKSDYMLVKFARKEKGSEEDDTDEINDEEVEGLGHEEEIEDEDFDSEDEDQDEEEEKPFTSAAWDIIKDVAIAFIIVIMIISSIYIYTGNWPPVVVVESDSMQHSDTESFLGVIDTGDLVLVKRIESRSDVVSYMEGVRTGHWTYDEPGDVLIYKKNGFPQSQVTPVIHRALIWLRYNESGYHERSGIIYNGSFDLPELKHHREGADENDAWQDLSGRNRWYNLSGTILLRDIGWDKQDVMIHLHKILENYDTHPDVIPHSGFITLGDHNRGRIDQEMLDAPDGKTRPVKPEWVVGVARGELPWFGLIKLYFQDNTITQRAPSNSFTMLWVSLILIFAVPISIDIILILYERRKEKKEVSKKDSDEEDKKDLEEPPPDEGDIDEDEPPPDDDMDEEETSADDEVDEKETSADDEVDEKGTSTDEETESPDDFNEDDLPPPDD
jgi:signal peptidase